MIITLRDGLTSERAGEPGQQRVALCIRGDKSCESVNRGIQSLPLSRGPSVSGIASRATDEPLSSSLASPSVLPVLLSRSAAAG